MRLRHILPTLLLATGIAAHADSFTITGTGVSISFSLPASPQVQYATGPNVDPEGFWINQVVMTINGQTQTEAIDFYTTKVGGGLSIEDAGQGSESDAGAGLLIDTTGLQLFTGTLASPTFTPGTYTLLTDTFSASEPTYQGTFQLTITPDPTTVAATPEPSSLALLGTGIVGLAGLAKKRLV